MVALKDKRMKSKTKLVVIITSFLLITITATVFYAIDAESTASYNPCNGTGITRNPDGTFHFSQLQVLRGLIVDQNNCIVYLSGFNTAGTEFGDAIGGMNISRIRLLKKTFRMNLWRLNINVTWWNEDVYVPDIHLNYRDWITQIITWMKANGNYVEITRTNQYPSGQYPPCGKDLSYNPPINITLCPSQSQGPNRNPWNNNSHFLDETVTFWRSIVPIYKNDPAIMYDIWNEMPGVSNHVLWKDFEERLISTVRAFAPHSLIFLGGPNDSSGIVPLVNGTVPDFKQANLVYDFHVYPVSWWYSHWSKQPETDTLFAQLHNHGVDIGEFGTGSNYSPYLDNVIKFAIKHDAAITQYQQSNVMTNKGQLTVEGQIIQEEYASIPSITFKATPQIKKITPTTGISKNS